MTGFQMKFSIQPITYELRPNFPYSPLGFGGSLNNLRIKLDTKYYNWN